MRRLHHSAYGQGCRLIIWGRVLALALVLVACAGVVHAQTPVANPTTVSFIPSDDHNAVDATGRPLISEYDLEFYQQGAAQPLLVTSLGKPSPADDGNIYVDFMSIISAPPPTDVVLEARVTAVGPYGRGDSTPSNLFIFDTPAPDPTPTCVPIVSPTSFTASALGGSGSLAVSVAAGCSWQASSDVAWIAITSSASDSGADTVTLTVSINTTTSSRTGTLIVAGQVVTFVQDEQPVPTCSAAVSPASVSAAVQGGSATITVSVPTGCAWQASSATPWIVVTNGASGSGFGDVTVAFSANPDDSARTGSLTVAGQTIAVIEDGQPLVAAACAATVSPTTVTTPAAGKTGSVAVTIPSGCAWQASSNAAWISVTNGASGSGNATVSFVASSNPAEPRAGTLVVAGQVVTIAEDGTTTVTPTPTTPTTSTPTSTPNRPASSTPTSSRTGGRTPPPGARSVGTATARPVKR